MATRGTRALRKWAALALGLLAIGLAEVRAGDLPIDRGVGRPVPPFKLKDTQGKEVSLYSFAGKKAAVIVFTGVDCPVGNLYMGRLVELSKAYKDKGVVFLAINSNAQETAEQVAEHAKSHDLPFAVLKDTGNLVADLLLAERTCETLVLDERAVIRYRGAIDDQYAQKAHKEKPAKTYVVDALDAVLAKKEVPLKATEVAGCPIERAAPKPAAQPSVRVRPAAAEIVSALKDADGGATADVGPVSYAADVAKIVQNKCQACHRPGQVGPFSLLSYDDARRHAQSIREVVDERRMPPWHADPRYGHFENDRSLSSKERATLLAWVDQGAPLGDPKAMPAPKVFPDGWGIGTPDAIFEMPESYTVAAQGTLPYQHFLVKTNFTEDRWVQAAEAQPGDRSAVHHIIVYVLPPGGRARGKKTLQQEAERHLCAFAPGDLPSVYPTGSAKKIPAGSSLIFEIHYTPVGTVKTDRSRVGLIFAKEPPMRQALTRPILNHDFKIPPNAAKHEVKSTITLEDDIHLLTFFPHMHLRGRDFQYKATYPDGKSEILLSVPAYDFAWQSAYRLVEPKAMPKGTVIDCVAHFDNSAGNPANPDPNATVRWGDQTFEEMMIGYIDYVADAPITPAKK